MRYAIVTETYPPEVNGVALTVQGLEAGLRGRGHQVSLVRPRQPGEHDAADDPGQHRVPGLPLPRYPGLRFGLPASRRLRADWRRHRPNAVYVATEGPLGWSALNAAQALGIPVATGFHTRFDQYMRSYDAAWLARPALAWMRRFHNRGDATVVPTSELAALLRAQGFEHAVRLPRAVDTGLFDPGRRDRWLRSRWGLGDGDLAVVHVGRIAAEKNLPLAVRAFRALQRERPRARLVWIGDGPQREALQRAHPDFIFAGMQRGDALARHFASGDLCLFPSRSETFGNVTLEAMASGVATVAFDYGAAREYLRHDRHGATVPVGDDEGFVAAVVHLGGADARRRAMGAAARTAALSLCPHRVAAEFDALLAGLARPAGGRRCQAA